MPTVTTADDVSITVHDFGGHGPDALFVHATGFHGLVWRPLVEHLLPHLHCVALDLRGHGDSGVRGDGNFSWDGLARDVRAAIDGLALSRPFGIGHSGGGAAVLMTEEDDPGTFAALYCFEPIVMPPLLLPHGHDENPMSAGARRRREVFPSRQAAYDNFMSKPPLNELSAAAMRAYVDHGFEDLPDGTVRLKCRGEHEARMYEQSSTHDTWERLGDIRCPVTVAGGGRSGSPPAPLLVDLAAHVPRGRAESFPDLGHFGPLEDPAAVAAGILRAFFAA